MHHRCRSEGKITFNTSKQVAINRKSNQDYFSRAKEKINNYERDTRQLMIRKDYGI